MNYKIKMSRRLQQIDAMISQSYQHIWDCCCDHGFLGLSLLKRQAADTVHFVDIVPALLRQLESDLKIHYGQVQNRSRWNVHCSDVINLPLTSVSENPESDKHLIIIAGVGGELSIELMTAILSQFSNYPLEFILCPVHHNYKVREFLISRQLGLIAESLIIENKRGYEILHVALNVTEPITRVGSKMWDFSQKEHIDYLQKSIKHYQRIAKNPQQDVQAIITQYQSLRTPIDSAY
ncbi:S-adenosylmethionine-dependent methyltransferase [Psychromonas ingrahamii 37]|uniref:S-adenosylmethionine-dependent methyltransferase n=1 Tax=Psychromonas ingrahamii (strain DSM 17664 / CCUG 51855 / 37) TaxID=357804 RepID=A1SVS3_PSYIN|nr:tRNA (adenine(22)-N(1))-methyltransferase TrmK [Psychromonas ingrahamii]ABM03588.1 S-adenosylmethionine-dependent methyltransferase [Psychromonas ingrahamii 37]